MRILRITCLAVALAAAGLAPVHATTPTYADAGAIKASCGEGYYRNSAGRCIRRPARTPDNRPPSGASARCRDGTYSFSQSRRGTCSGHGGVARWL